MLNSYGSIYALGHIAVKDIFDGEVTIEEKTDGSQCSFLLENGELSIRSKNQQLYQGSDPGMFKEAVEKIEAVKDILTPGFVYRGEYLRKPRHNTLNYTRPPKNHIIIYDIERSPGTSDYLKHEERTAEAERIGFEAIPVFYHGTQGNLEMVKGFLENESVLGGVKIEGVVVKRSDIFGEDKKPLRAKFVSSEFAEQHQKEWKKENPSRKDIITEIIEVYCHEGRWRKGVQHMRDDGVLEGSPRDIGALIKTVQEDLKKEEEENIKDILFRHFIPQILRGSTAGLAQFYKEQLAEGSI